MLSQATPVQPGFTCRQCGYRACLPSLGRLSLPLFYVGLVGEAWKVGVGLLDMALLADHSGLTRFSFDNQLPDERGRMLLSFSLSANFEIS